MKRGLRLTAVAAMVVVTLTGFSTGRGHGHARGHGGGGGGGCSSSSQDHDSTSSSGSSGSSGFSGSDSSGSGSSGSTYDDDDDTYGSSSGGTATRRPRYRSTPTASATGGGSTDLRDGRAKVVRCATAQRPYATVEVSNPNEKTVVFKVYVTFNDKNDDFVAYESDMVKVPGKGKATGKVAVGGEGRAAAVRHCYADPEAEAEL